MNNDSKIKVNDEESKIENSRHSTESEFLIINLFRQAKFF